MLQRLILKNLISTLLTNLKGGKLWLIALVAACALGLSAAFDQNDILADFGQSVLAIACETNE